MVIKPLRPWVRRLVAVAAAWLLWRIGGPDGISPLGLALLGTFLFFVGVPVLSVVRVIVIEGLSFDLWIPYVVTEVAEAVWGSRESGQQSAIERVRRWKARRERVSHASKRVAGPRQTSARWRQASLIAHATGNELARCTYPEGCRARSAMQGVLESADAEGTVITVDSVDATFRAVKALVDNSADFVSFVNDECPFAYRILADLDWETDSVRRYCGRWHLRDCESVFERRLRGRRALRGRVWEHSKIEVWSPRPYVLPFRHARQVFRVTVRMGKSRRRPDVIRILYGVTSLPPDRAGPSELVLLLRRHEAIASLTRDSADATTPGPSPGRALDVPSSVGATQVLALVLSDLTGNLVAGSNRTMLLSGTSTPARCRDTDPSLERRIGSVFQSSRGI